MRRGVEGLTLGVVAREVSRRFLLWKVIQQKKWSCVAQIT
jgi:hypothetical protein